jgi:hypothetical protein
MKKQLALLVIAPLSLVALAAPGNAKTATAKVGTKCTKSGLKAKTAKGSALVCKKSGSTLKWSLAPKAKATDSTVPAKKSADTTVPKKSADTTVPKKSADTTVPKA